MATLPANNATLAGAILRVATVSLLSTWIVAVAAAGIGTAFLFLVDDEKLMALMLEAYQRSFGDIVDIFADPDLRRRVDILVHYVPLLLGA